MNSRQEKHDLSIIAACAAGVMLLAVAFAACGDDGGPSGLCEPGTNVFCRCPGGDAGTQNCRDDGESFGDCEIAPDTPCGERVECEPDSTVSCLCPDGTSGEKTCLREGNGYTECFVGGDEPCPQEGQQASSSSASGGGGGPPTGCAHELCETGNALDASCDPCVASVCAVPNVGSYCCETQWDGICVELVDTECNNLCNPQVVCAHDPCDEGAPLPNSCDPCVASVCTVDSFCCDVNMMQNPPGTWDSYCVASVKDGASNPACSGLCCAHNECLEGAALDPSCSNCADVICSADAYCCNSSWDSTCVNAAAATPSCNCN
jgi:hypothetical protein